eukprot:2642078-Prymnesium_polylepis.1
MRGLIGSRRPYYASVKSHVRPGTCLGSYGVRRDCVPACAGRRRGDELISIHTVAPQPSGPPHKAVSRGPGAENVATPQYAETDGHTYLCRTLRRAPPTMHSESHVVTTLRGRWLPTLRSTCCPCATASARQQSAESSAPRAGSSGSRCGERAAANFGLSSSPAASSRRCGLCPALSRAVRPIDAGKSG